MDSSTWLDICYSSKKVLSLSESETQSNEKCLHTSSGSIEELVLLKQVLSYSII